jgi:flagellar motor switch/type III secretory pathway protein FliN
MSSSQTSSSSSNAAASEHPLAGMLDVLCKVDVVLGSGWITVRDCLRLQRHGVLRLRQSAGSDLEVRVHGVTAATGEVVIVDDSTAVRVTQVATPPGESAA